MSSSTPPESPPTARTQFFIGGIRFRPSLYWTPHHFNPLHVESYFGVSWFTYSLQPAELPASLADLTRQLNLPSQRRLLLPSFRPSRSPSSPSDITTVASGHLHRQHSHLLEWQLAALHERGVSQLIGPTALLVLQPGSKCRQHYLSDRDRDSLSPLLGPYGKCAIPSATLRISRPRNFASSAELRS